MQTQISKDKKVKNFQYSNNPQEEVKESDAYNE